MKSENTPLSVGTILKIIKACREAEVTRFKLRELEMELAPKSELRAVSSPAWPVPASPFPADTEISEAETQTRDQADHELELKRAELRLRGDQIAEMQLVDPYLYEQLTASGELIDEKA